MRRTLIITGRLFDKAGNTNGRDWTRTRLNVTDEHGNMLDGEWKTFDADKLPDGVPVEVEVEEHPKYGMTVKAITGGSQGASNGSSGPSTDSAYENLATQVRLLLDRVGALETKVFGAAPDPFRNYPPQMPPEPPVGGGVPGSDDIPFAPSVI